MSPESAQKATEAIAQRLAASVPSATQAQQEAIKTSIAAGINEYQQQIAQGREPGIDLQSIIDGAANEAGLSSAQMQQLNAQTEAQALLGGAAPLGAHPGACAGGFRRSDTRAARVAACRTLRSGACAA